MRVLTKWRKSGAMEWSQSVKCCLYWNENLNLITESFGEKKVGIAACIHNPSFEPVETEGTQRKNRQREIWGSLIRHSSLVSETQFYWETLFWKTKWMTLWELFLRLYTLLCMCIFTNIEIHRHLLEGGCLFFSGCLAPK